MMKTFAAGVLGMTVCLFAPSPAASQERPPASEPETTVPMQNALSADQVRKLLEGNTELGQGMKGEEATGLRWTAYFATNGMARMRRGESGQTLVGTWFVDANGQNCCQWEGKEEPKCDAIVPQGDHYLRVREGQVRARVKIEKGNPDHL